MGIEPTSLQSQYNILPFKLLPLQEEGIEPSFLISKTNVLPFRRLLWHRRDLNPQNSKPKFDVSTISPRCQSWDGNWTHTNCFADNYNTIMLLSPVPRGNRTLIIWLTVTCSTIKLARLTYGGTWTHTSENDKGF